MGNAEPLGQSLSLGTLAGARSADQQKAHLITRIRPGHTGQAACTWLARTWRASSWPDRPIVLLRSATRRAPSPGRSGFVATTYCLFLGGKRSLSSTETTGRAVRGGRLWAGTPKRSARASRTPRDSGAPLCRA